MNDGGPAFPVTTTFGEDGSPQHTGFFWDGNGMSLRDYFAAAALGAHVEASILMAKESGDEDTRTGAQIAEACYRLADAMLIERTKTT